MKTRTIITLIISAAFAAPAFAHDDQKQETTNRPAAIQPAVKQPDFSGTWQLDTAASKFNGIPAASAAATEISFAQQAKSVAYGKLAKGFDGAPYYFRDTLSFDGKPSIKVIPNTGENK